MPNPLIISQLQGGDRIINQLQQNIAAVVNPIAANPITQGVFKLNVSLVPGTNLISHGLGRAYQGWIITGMHSVYSQIYDVANSQPELFLELSASIATSVDIYVF